MVPGNCKEIKNEIVSATKGTVYRIYDSYMVHMASHAYLNGVVGMLYKLQLMWQTTMGSGVHSNGIRRCFGLN